jgi:hypothetical protein
VYPNGYIIKGSGEVIYTGKYFDDFKERHLKPAEGKKRIA